MNRILLKAAACVLVIGTVACEPAPKGGSGMKGMDMDMDMMMAGPNDSAATAGYKSAMMKMMQATPKFTGDADVDFMKQMRGHHQAAIDMANVVLGNGKDEETKILAREIITAQEREIAVIDAWLKNKGA